MIKKKSSGIEGIYLTILKANDTASIILNSEKLSAFSLRSETRQGWSLSLLFNILLEV